MKTIGLIGGMSWEIDYYYYRQIQRDDQRTLGRSAFGEDRPLYVDFHEIERLQHAGNWKPPEPSWPMLLAT